LFKDGWKPSVRTRKKDGYRYIRLKRAKKGSDGKWKNKEKTLGAYDPERWEALLELFPERDKVFPHKPVSPRKTMVLASKGAKPKQMGSSGDNPKKIRKQISRDSSRGKRCSQKKEEEVKG